MNYAVATILFIGLGIVSGLLLYLWTLAIVFFAASRRSLRAESGLRTNRFVFIVPAHNEEKGIAATIRSLKSVDYPQSLFDIVVVADNCTDRTAEYVKLEGAQCLERFDDKLKGKGYALRFAFTSLLPEKYDAFIIVDADSVVSSNFLLILDGRINQGQKVVQAYDGLSNADASILTYLFQVGNIIENRLFWEPKDYLGQPVLLRGNGMCFTSEILKKYPWNAFSIVEDTEYGLMLLEHKIRIHFAPEIGVYAHQPENLQQAFVQRVRWAAGNSALTKTRAINFIISGVSKGNFSQVDVGLSLIVCSKPLLILFNLILIAASALIENLLFLSWSTGLLICQILYIGLGVIMNGFSSQKLIRLILSPFYLAWLCIVSILGFAGFRKSQWLRTTR